MNPASLRRFFFDCISLLNLASAVWSIDLINDKFIALISEMETLSLLSISMLYEYFIQPDVSVATSKRQNRNNFCKLKNFIVNWL